MKFNNAKGLITVNSVIFSYKEHHHSFQKMKKYKAVFRIACKLLGLSIIIVFAIFLLHDEIETSIHTHCHCPGKNLIIVSHVHSNMGDKAKKNKHDTNLVPDNFSLQRNKLIFTNSSFIISSSPFISLTAPTILRL